MSDYYVDLEHPETEWEFAPFWLVCILIAILSSNIVAQNSAYGQGCDSFNAYSLWTPVTGAKVEIMAYPQRANQDDMVVLALGFARTDLAFGTPGCRLYVYPALHFHAKLPWTRFVRIPVVKSIPKGFKGLRLYFQAYCPRQRTTSNGIEVRIQ